MKDVAAALDAWREAIGAEHVLADEASVTAAATATFATTQQVPAVLRPGNVAEVQECVRVANRHGMTLYPVSTGKNWGYGSRVPVADGSAVLELGRLNRILELNEALGYVVIQPGVTFGQLWDYLEEQGSNLMQSVTGAGQDAGPLGHAMERGHSFGKYGDRFGTVCAFQVVLPTGEVIRTGLGRFEGAKAAHVHRYGVGPYLEGLFTQSNLGIVTELTLWLEPRPKNIQLVLFSLRSEEKLAGTVDALRELALEGTIPETGFGAYNDYMNMAVSGPYPWEAAGGKTPLPQEQLLEGRKKLAGSVWGGMIPLYSASRGIGHARWKVIKKRLGPEVDRIVLVDRRLQAALRLAHAPLKLLLGVDLSSLSDPEFLEANLGNPKNNTMHCAYWRKPKGLPDEADPDRDRCGMIWLAPMIPAEGAQVRAAVDLIKEVAVAHEFEPTLVLMFLHGRVIEILTGILYDRDVEGEDQRAEACHREMFQRLADAGYYAVRATLQSMDWYPSAGEPFGSVLEALKRQLDPNDVLAPGRYDFREDWASEP